MSCLLKSLPLLAFTLLTFTTAAPITIGNLACRVIQVSTTATSQQATTGTGTQLPTSNLTLKYIALGHGIQNYTCASTSSIPVAIGAIATFYDITTLRSNIPLADMLPPLAVYMPLPATSAFTFDPITLLPGTAPSSVLGHHYFRADGTPTFDLNGSGTGDILYGKKLDDIKAPASANPGPQGTGAVDWLFLGDKGGSVGVSQVYRIVTAGGAAPATCAASAVGTVSVPYAAEYWFYG